MSVGRIADYEWRMAGCGDACVPRRHDPLDHEQHGRQQALAELRRRVVATGDLRIDLDRWEVRVCGRVVDPGWRQRALLLLLAQNVGRVVSYDRCCREAWGADSTERTRHLVRTAAQRLRRTLGPAGSRVATVVGGGLMLEVDA